MGVTVQDLLERAKENATHHQPIPTFPECKELGIESPHIICVSCADPRVVPENIFQSQLGELIVLRNVAGHPQGVLNSIVALDAFLGCTDIIVVHHTDCGSTYFKDEDIRASLKQRHLDDAEIGSLTFGAISTSLEQSVKDDLNFLKNTPLIRKELSLHGFLYDIKSGKLEEIKA